MGFSPKDSMWILKHRPKKISDMVGDFKDKVLSYLSTPSSIPHFLLYSKTPGTGKTTLALAIINELGCDSLILNSSDDRKIDVIREKVKQFAMTQSSKKGVKRCVFLDEVDGMWRVKDSQDALRNIMETYGNNVFFILTCNNIQKVIDPLQSRCTAKISFTHPNKDDVYKYLINICAKENVKYTDVGIKKLIELNYPSIRNCVGVLQDLYVSNKEVTEENVRPFEEEFELLWKKLMEKDWKYIKKVILKSEIDARDLNIYFWHKALEQESLRLIQICCRNEKDISCGANENIIVVTSLIEICKLLYMFKR